MLYSVADSIYDYADYFDVVHDDSNYDDNTISKRSKYFSNSVTCHNENTNTLNDETAFNDMIAYLVENTNLDWNNLSPLQFIQKYSSLIFSLCK